MQLASVNFTNCNFPNVQQVMLGLPMLQKGRDLLLGWARGPRTAAKQTWEVAAWEIAHLGNTLGKLQLGKISLGKYLASTINYHNSIIIS